VKLFEPLSQIAAQVDKNFVERRDDRTLYVAANNAMRRAFPPAQQLSNAGQPQLRSTTNDSGDGDLNSVYETALVIVKRAAIRDRRQPYRRGRDQRCAGRTRSALRLYHPA
jgi:hypothetical protein